MHVAWGGGPTLFSNLFGWLVLLKREAGVFQKLSNLHSIFWASCLVFSIFPILPSIYNLVLPSPKELKRGVDLSSFFSLLFYAVRFRPIR